MQMESPEGEVRLVEIGPQSICYVPPFWIHRSINVGAGDLVMMFAYPADSGQDYGIIERAGGLRVRVVDDGAGGWAQVNNPDWRPRGADEIAAIYRGGGAAA
jgi:glucose-6-phosphate isomerase